MAGVAVVGKFVVGDGTLVGQSSLDATVVVGKAKLTLNGKAFAAVIYTGDFFVAPFIVRPKLVLAGKQATILADSTVVLGKPKLLLNGEPTFTLVPDFAHMGKPALVLKGGAFVLGISAIEDFGSPRLILKGKHFNAGVVALTPTVPVNIILNPTVPVADIYLVPSAPQSYDLVPTVQEFR